MPRSKRRVLPNISSPAAPAKLFGQIQLEQLLIPPVLLCTAYYLESGGHRGLIHPSPNVASWVFCLKFVEVTKAFCVSVKSKGYMSKPRFQTLGHLRPFCLLCICEEKYDVLLDKCLYSHTVTPPNALKWSGISSPVACSLELNQSLQAGVWVFTNSAGSKSVMTSNVLVPTLIGSCFAMNI